MGFGEVSRGWYEQQGSGLWLACMAFGSRVGLAMHLLFGSVKECEPVPCWRHIVAY